jgi:flagellar biosynthesis/type III secretory pathway protein FliH
MGNVILELFKELGEKEGMEKGMKKGMEKGMEKGLEKGMEKGVEIGKAKGEEIGKMKGEKAGILNVLTIHKGIKANTPIEQLAAETHMPIEEVKRICDELLTV